MTATTERTEHMFDSAIPSACPCGASVSQWESPAFFCPDCGRPLFEEPAAWSRIMAAPMPKPAHRIVGLRNASRKELAARIRDVLKAAGVKGVSVTAPNYSMAQSIRIRIPSRTPWHSHAPEGEAWAPMPRYRCPICNRENQVHERLERLILAAYPDLDDRSDSQTDHFDYRLSIH